MSEAGKMRMEQRDAFRVVGMSGQFTFATASQIAPMWERFMPRMGEIAGAREWCPMCGIPIPPGFKAGTAPSDGNVETHKRREAAGEKLISYGVCVSDEQTASGGPFTYIAGVRVDADAQGKLPAVPSGLVALEIPAARYAVFTHKGPVWEIGNTIKRIYSEWLPAAKLSHAGTPEFELYDERFHPEHGETEIWIPVK